MHSARKIASKLVKLITKFGSDWLKTNGYITPQSREILQTFEFPLCNKYLSLIEYLVINSWGLLSLMTSLGTNTVTVSIKKLLSDCLCCGPQESWTGH